MAYLDRKAFAAARNLKTADLDIEGVGRVKLRQPSALELSKIEKIRKTLEKDDHLMAMAVFACCVVANGDGEPMYDPEKEEDQKEMASRSPEVLSAIVEAASEQFKAKTSDEVNEQAKNLEKTGGEDSPSVSAESSDSLTPIS